jgi:hypothetical protein
MFQNIDLQAHPLTAQHTQAQLRQPNTHEASDIKQKRRQQTEAAIRKSEHLQQGRTVWDIRTAIGTNMHVCIIMYILEYGRTTSYYVMWSKEGMRAHKLRNCNTATQAHVQNKYEANKLTKGTIQRAVPKIEHTLWRNTARYTINKRKYPTISLVRSKDCTITVTSTVQEIYQHTPRLVPA